MLAPSWDLGHEENGLWIYAFTNPAPIINLSNGSVTLLDGSGKITRQTFREWAADNPRCVIDLDDSEDFFFEDAHKLIPDVEQFLLDSSDSRHKNLATSAALLVLSTLLAPIYCSPWKRGKLNLFHCCVAYSGDGKADYLNGLEKIIEQSIGKRDITIAQPGSPEGLLDALGTKNFGIVSLNEGEKLLASCEGTPLNGVLKVLDSLWANEKIKGKRNRVNSIATIDMGLASVYLQMVPNSFSDVLGNPEVSVGGISSRFSWCFSDKEGRSNNNDQIVEVPESIIKKLKTLSAPLLSAIIENENENENRKLKATPLSPFKPLPLQFQPDVQVEFEDGAKELFVEWKAEFKAENKRYREQYPTLSAMYVRMAEKILRQATLVCVYEQYDKPKKFVTVETLRKVRAFEEYLAKETKQHFKLADAISEHEKVREKVLHLISKNPKGIRRSELRNGIRTKDKTVIDIVIKQLQMDGIIEDVPELGRTGKDISRLFFIGEKQRDEPKVIEQSPQPF